MNRFLFALLLALTGVGSLFSCHKNKPENTQSWGFNPPDYFPPAVYDMESKQSYGLFVLGRELFYEDSLSSTNTVNCGTCHHPTHAFSAHNTALTEGVNGLVGTRNAPAIFNMAWSPVFMWDGRIHDIESMPVAPITNPIEMNENFDHIVQKLSGSTSYKNMFRQAFGTEEMTSERILKALAQFMGMITSSNSKYDQVRKGKASFSAQEQQGYELFQQHCASCHQEPLFTDYSYRNNGLDTVFSDSGRMMATGNSADLAKFKVPTLRNVMMTYPYMHDGRFFSIQQVLAHYSTGVKQSATLDPLLQQGIPLTSADQSALIAFLKTLNDDALLNNTYLWDTQH